MPTSRDVDLVNTQVAEAFSKMEPRHIALLIAKIMNPDRPLTDLSSELWPDLGYDRRKQIIQASQVTKVLGMVKDRPWVLATIMSNKLAPVMTAVLYDLALTAGKENVRATAAKELIRLAQSTARSLAPSDDEPLPAEEQDELLESLPTLAESARIEELPNEAEPLSADALLDS